MPPEGFDHRASLCFRYPDQRRARQVAAAVAVERGEIDDARSRTRIENDGAEVIVEVLADDLVALRAGMNTWRRLIEVAETVGSTVEP